jgi:hypothetical protein
VKSYILNEEVNVKDPASKEASPKSPQLKADEINLPISIINTIRSCNNLDLSGDNVTESPSRQGGGSSYSTPKKTAPLSSSKSGLKSAMTPSSAGSLQSPHSMSKKAQGTPSHHHKTALDTGIVNFSESKSPKLSSRSPADIHKYRPKSSSFLSPHKQLYDDFLYEKTTESLEEKEQQARLLASRQTLDDIKKDMKTVLNKMNVYINTNNKTGWK